ncbi:MAG: pilus assembly protein PilM, partial [Verrucomicrobiae bacterium]|nr:pilus assembly protein PilM [Verrucomicrobiae bacterium]
REELQKLVNDLHAGKCRTFVTLSCASAIVCQTEFPPMPLDEIKSALKLNSARYLRRDFSSYYLDAAALQSYEVNAKSNDAARAKILVGGASKDDVDACREALLAAKIKPESIELAAVSVINSLMIALPEVSQEVVVLVDIGARATSINFLHQGVPVMTRIMHFGGSQISDYIAQALRLEPQEAEQEKRKMPEPVRELARTALSPLAREIRSSLDFFERQHDQHVRRVFACGGTACSTAILELLSEAVGLPVECWNPVTKLNLSGLNGDSPAALAEGPSLAAALGAAMARLN